MSYLPDPVLHVEDPGNGEAPKGSGGPQVLLPTPLELMGKPGGFGAVRSLAIHVLFIYGNKLKLTYH